MNRDRKSWLADSFCLLSSGSWLEEKMEKEVEKKFLVEYKYQQKKEFEVSLPMPRVISLDLFDFFESEVRVVDLL